MIRRKAARIRSALFKRRLADASEGLATEHRSRFSALRLRLKRASAPMSSRRTTLAETASLYRYSRNYTVGRTSLSQRSVTSCKEPELSPLETTLAGACSTLTGIFVVLSLATAYLFTAHAQVLRWLRQREEYEPCPTAYCSEIARELSSSMPLRDGCGDFYQSVCDDVFSDNPLRQQDATWSQQSAMYEQRLARLVNFLDTLTAKEHPVSKPLSALYRSCKENRSEAQGSAISELMSILTIAGIPGWPLEADKAIKASSVIARATRYFNLPMVVVIKVRADILDATKPSIHVEDPTLLLGLVEHLHPEWYPNRRDSYHSYISRVMSGMLEFLGSGSSHKTLDIYTFASNMVEFEGRLAEHLRLRSDEEDFQPQFHRYTAPDLVLMNDMEQWMAVIAEAYKWNETDNYAINIPRFIPNLRYMQYLNGVMLEDPVGMVNYIGWRLVEYFVWMLSDTFFQYRQEFHRTRMETERVIGREQYCIKHAVALLPFTASRLYRFAIAERDPTVTSLVSHMVTSIKTALTVLLQECPWIDRNTTAIAAFKVATMSVGHGFGRVPEEEELGDQYTLRTPEYVTRVIGVVRHQARAQLNSLVRPDAVLLRDVDHMGSDPIYYPYHNVLHIPVGLLEYPLFSPRLTAGINFAYVGFVIAHEMLKAVVGPGRLYQNSSFTGDWWTEYTAANYIPNFLCLHNIHKQLDLRDREVNDIIRGIGAVHLAYKAFKIFLGQKAEEVQYSQIPRLLYTQSQLFFLVFAKNLCLRVRKEYSRAFYRSERAYVLEQSDRVNLLVNHIAKFHKAFNCYPVYSCSFWRLEDADWTLR